MSSSRPDRGWRSCRALLARDCKRKKKTARGLAGIGIALFMRNSDRNNHRQGVTTSTATVCRLPAEVEMALARSGRKQTGAGVVRKKPTVPAKTAIMLWILQDAGRKQSAISVNFTPWRANIARLIGASESGLKIQAMVKRYSRCCLNFGGILGAKREGGLDGRSATRRDHRL